MKLITFVTMIGTATLFCQVPINVPKLSAHPGVDLKIPLTTGDLSGQNVTSFEFVVSCDTSVLKLTGVEQEGTLSTGLTMFANNRVRPFNPGRMKVVCASAQPLSGSGVLVYLTAKTQKAIGVTQIQLSNFVLNTGTPATQITNGVFTASVPENAKKATSRDTVPLTRNHPE